MLLLARAPLRPRWQPGTALGGCSTRTTGTAPRVLCPAPTNLGGNRRGRLRAVQTENEVVGRPNELSSVDRPSLDGLQDLATRDGDLFSTKVGEDLAGQTGNTHFQTVEVADGLDWLGEPATHLAAGGSRGKADRPVL